MLGPVIISISVLTPQRGDRQTWPTHVAVVIWWQNRDAQTSAALCLDLCPDFMGIEVGHTSFIYNNFCPFQWGIRGRSVEMTRLR